MASKCTRSLLSCTQAVPSKCTHSPLSCLCAIAPSACNTCKAAPSSHGPLQGLARSVGYNIRRKYGYGNMGIIQTLSPRRVCEKCRKYGTEYEYEYGHGMRYAYRPEIEGVHDKTSLVNYVRDLRGRPVMMEVGSRLNRRCEQTKASMSQESCGAERKRRRDGSCPREWRRIVSAKNS
eukprot:1159970-Pelagomonas_calceolata.AAC.10